MKIEITKDETIIEGTAYQLDVTAFMLLSMSVKNNPERLSRIQQFMQEMLPTISGMKADIEVLMHPFLANIIEYEVPR